MFDCSRARKKKSLTDPVAINPFPGQNAKRPKKAKPSVKQNSIKEKTETPPPPSVEDQPLEKKKRASLKQRSTSKLKIAQPSIAELKQEHIKKKAEEIDIDAVDDSAPTYDYTHDEFMKVWNKIIQEQTEQNNHGVAIGLKNVTLQPNYEILVTVESHVQESAILDQRVDIVQRMRKELNNGRIRLKLKISEQEVTQKKYLTNKDKFAKLAEKNPALNKMRKKFKLDIDL